MIRVGLIGAGKHARRYAKHLREDFPEIELVGVARRDAARAEEAAREFGCRPFSDFRALIDAAVDAVIVVTPPTLHFEIVGCAAPAGRAVLLEKPAAPSLAVGRRMREAVAQNPVPVMVAQTLRYNSVVRAFVRARAEIGPIHALSFTQGFEPSSLAWLDDPAISGGGMTLHTGIHMFDLVRWLSGLEADAVTCRMERIFTQHTEDTFGATIRCGSGQAVATVCGSRTLGGRMGHMELAGESGVLVGDHVLHEAQLIIGSQRHPLALDPPAPTLRDVLRDFFDALSTGGPMPVPLDEGLRAVAIADACAVAARSGCTAPVERVG